MDTLRSYRESLDDWGDIDSQIAGLFNSGGGFQQNVPKRDPRSITPQELRQMEANDVADRVRQRDNASLEKQYAQLIEQREREMGEPRTLGEWMQRTLVEDASRSFGAGVSQVMSGNAGLIKMGAKPFNWLEHRIADLYGLDDYKGAFDMLEETADESMGWWSKRAAQLTNSVEGANTLPEIKNAVDFTEWFVNGVFNQIPIFADLAISTMATGGVKTVGTAGAKSLAGASARKGIFKPIAKGIAAAQKAASPITRQKVVKRLADIMLGKNKHMFFAGSKLEVGSIYSDLREMGEQEGDPHKYDNPLVAVVGGLIAGRLEAIGFGRIWSLLAGDNKTVMRTARRGIMRKLFNDSKFIQFMSGLADTSLTEGVTEFFQTAVEAASRDYVNENREVFSGEYLKRNMPEILEATAQGAALGGLFGVGTGTKVVRGETAKNRLEKEQREALFAELESRKDSGEITEDQFNEIVAQEAERQKELDSLELDPEQIFMEAVNRAQDAGETEIFNPDIVQAYAQEIVNQRAQELRGETLQDETNAANEASSMLEHGKKAGKILNRWLKPFLEEGVDSKNATNEQWADAIDRRKEELGKYNLQPAKGWEEVKTALAKQESGVAEKETAPEKSAKPISRNDQYTADEVAQKIIDEAETTFNDITDKTKIKKDAVDGLGYRNDKGKTIRLADSKGDAVKTTGKVKTFLNSAIAGTEAAIAESEDDAQTIELQAKLERYQQALAEISTDEGVEIEGDLDKALERKDDDDDNSFVARHNYLTSKSDPTLKRTYYKVDKKGAPVKENGNLVTEFKIPSKEERQQYSQRYDSIRKLRSKTEAEAVAEKKESSPEKQEPKKAKKQSKPKETKQKQAGATEEEVQESEQKSIAKMTDDEIRAELEERGVASTSKGVLVKDMNRKQLRGSLRWHRAQNTNAKPQAEGVTEETGATEKQKATDLAPPGTTTVASKAETATSKTVADILKLPELQQYREVQKMSDDDADAFKAEMEKAGKWDEWIKGYRDAPRDKAGNIIVDEAKAKEIRTPKALIRYKGEDITLDKSSVEQLAPGERLLYQPQDFNVFDTGRRTLMPGDAVDILDKNAQAMEQAEKEIYDEDAKNKAVKAGRIAGVPTGLTSRLGSYYQIIGERKENGKTVTYLLDMKNESGRSRTRMPKDQTRREEWLKLGNYIRYDGSVQDLLTDTNYKSAEYLRKFYNTIANVRKKMWNPLASEGGLLTENEKTVLADYYGEAVAREFQEYALNLASGKYGDITYAKPGQYFEDVESGKFSDAHRMEDPENYYIAKWNQSVDDFSIYKLRKILANARLIKTEDGKVLAKMSKRDLRPLVDSYFAGDLDGFEDVDKVWYPWQWRDVGKNKAAAKAHDAQRRKLMRLLDARGAQRLDSKGKTILATSFKQLKELYGEATINAQVFVNNAYDYLRSRPGMTLSADESADSIPDSMLKLDESDSSIPSTARTARTRLNYLRLANVNIGETFVENDGKTVAVMTPERKSTVARGLIRSFHLDRVNGGPLPEISSEPVIKHADRLKKAATSYLENSNSRTRKGMERAARQYANVVFKDAKKNFYDKSRKNKDGSHGLRNALSQSEELVVRFLKSGLFDSYFYANEVTGGSQMSIDNKVMALYFSGLEEYDNYIKDLKFDQARFKAMIEEHTMRKHGARTDNATYGWTESGKLPFTRVQARSRYNAAKRNLESARKGRTQYINLLTGKIEAFAQGRAQNSEAVKIYESGQLPSGGINVNSLLRPMLSEQGRYMLQMEAVNRRWYRRLVQKIQSESAGDAEITLDKIERYIMDMGYSDKENSAAWKGLIQFVDAIMGGRTYQLSINTTFGEDTEARFADMLASDPQGYGFSNVIVNDKRFPARDPSLTIESLTEKYAKPKASLLKLSENDIAKRIEAVRERFGSFAARMVLAKIANMSEADADFVNAVLGSAQASQRHGVTIWAKENRAIVDFLKDARIRLDRGRVLSANQTVTEKAQRSGLVNAEIMTQVSDWLYGTALVREGENVGLMTRNEVSWAATVIDMALSDIKGVEAKMDFVEQLDPMMLEMIKPAIAYNQHYTETVFSIDKRIVALSSQSIRNHVGKRQTLDVSKTRWESAWNPVDALLTAMAEERVMADLDRDAMANLDQELAQRARKLEEESPMIGEYKGERRSSPFNTGRIVSQTDVSEESAARAKLELDRRQRLIKDHERQRPYTQAEIQNMKRGEIEAKLLYYGVEKKALSKMDVAELKQRMTEISSIGIYVPGLGEMGRSLSLREIESLTLKEIKTVYDSLPESIRGYAQRGMNRKRIDTRRKRLISLMAGSEIQHIIDRKKSKSYERVQEDHLRTHIKLENSGYRTLLWAKNWILEQVASKKVNSGLVDAVVDGLSKNRFYTYDYVRHKGWEDLHLYRKIADKHKGNPEAQAQAILRQIEDEMRVIEFNFTKGKPHILYQNTPIGISIGLEKAQMQMGYLVDAANGSWNRVNVSNTAMPGDLLGYGDINGQLIELRAWNNGTAGGRTEFHDGRIVIYFDMDSGRNTTIGHETRHIAWRMLTGRQRKVLAKAFGMKGVALEEEVLTRIDEAVAGNWVVGQQSSFLRSAWEAFKTILSRMAHWDFAGAVDAFHEGLALWNKQQANKIVNDLQLKPETFLKGLTDKHLRDAAGKTFWQNGTIANSESEAVVNAVSNTAKLANPRKESVVPKTVVGRKILSARTWMKSAVNTMTDVRRYLYRIGGDELTDMYDEVYAIGASVSASAQRALVPADNAIEKLTRGYKATEQVVYKTLGKVYDPRLRRDIDREGGSQTLEVTRGQLIDLVTLGRAAMAARKSGNGATIRAANRIHTDAMIKAGMDPVDMTIADWAEIEKLVTPQEEKILQAIKKYNDILFEHMAKEYKNVYNEELKYEEWYTHLIRHQTLEAFGGKSTMEGEGGKVKTEPKQDIVVHVLDVFDPSIVQSRKGGEAPTIIRDFTEKRQRYHDAAMRFLEVAGAKKWLSKNLINNSTIKDIVSRTWGLTDVHGGLWEGLTTQVETMDGMMNPSAYKAFDRILRPLLANATVARLFSPFVIMKQPASVHNAASEVDTDSYVKGLRWVLAPKKEVIKRVVEKNDIIWKRFNIQRGFHPHMTSETGKFTGGPSYGAFRRLQRYSVAALGEAMHFGDKGAIHGIIGMAYYQTMKDTNLKEGSEEFYEEVGRLAANITVKTQVSVSPIDRSVIGRANSPTMAVVSMFFGAREKVINNTIENWIRFRRGLKMKGAEGRREVMRSIRGLTGTLAFGLGTVAMVDLIRHALRRPEDFEDEDGYKTMSKAMTLATQHMIDTVVGTIPGSSLGLTSMVAAVSPVHDAKTRWLYTEWQGEHPAWSMLKYPPMAMNSLRKAWVEYEKSNDYSLNHRQRKAARLKAERSMDAATKYIINGMSETLGIPVNQIIRMWNVKS